MNEAMNSGGGTPGRNDGCGPAARRPVPVFFIVLALIVFGLLSTFRLALSFSTTDDEIEVLAAPQSGTGGAVPACMFLSWIGGDHAVGRPGSPPVARVPMAARMLCVAAFPVTMIALYLLCSRIYGSVPAIAAPAMYVLLQPVQGNGALACPEAAAVALGLCALSAALMCVRNGVARARCIAAGVVLGLVAVSSAVGWTWICACLGAALLASRYGTGASGSNAVSSAESSCGAGFDRWGFVCLASGTAAVVCITGLLWGQYIVARTRAWSGLDGGLLLAGRIYDASSGFVPVLLFFFLCPVPLMVMAAGVLAERFVRQEAPVDELAFVVFPLAVLVVRLLALGSPFPDSRGLVFLWPLLCALCPAFVRLCDGRRWKVFCASLYLSVVVSFLSSYPALLSGGNLVVRAFCGANTARALGGSFSRGQDLHLLADRLGIERAGGFRAVGAGRTGDGPRIRDKEHGRRLEETTGSAVAEGGAWLSGEVEHAGRPGGAGNAQAPVYLLPWPPSVPVCGTIAVPCLGMVDIDGRGEGGLYSWLDLFEPRERVGGWLVFDVDGRDFERLCAEDPSDPRRWYVRMRCLYGAGRYDELLKIAEEAAPVSRQASFFKALALIGLGEYGRALRALPEPAGSLFPEEIVLWRDVLGVLVSADQRANATRLHLAAASYRLLPSCRPAIPVLDAFLARFDPSGLDLVSVPPETRLLAGLVLLDRFQPARAAAFFESLEYTPLAGRCRFQSYWCKRVNSALTGDDPGRRAKGAVELAEELRMPERAWRLLRKELVSHPHARGVIEAFCRFRRLRRLSLPHFDSGAGDLLDLPARNGRIRTLGQRTSL